MLAFRICATVVNMHLGAMCIGSISCKHPATMTIINSTIKYCTQINLSSESKVNDIKGQNYSFNDGVHLTDISPSFKRNELSPKFIHELLIKSLHCSTEEAQNLYKQYPQMRDFQPNAYLNTVNYLHDHGIEKTLLRNNFWLFLHSFTTIKQRLEVISKVEGIEDSVLLVKFNLPTLKHLCENWNPERLNFIKEKTGWKMNYLVNNPYFLTCDFNVFREKFNLLQKHGLQIEDLKENAKVFQLSLTHIQNRLNECAHFDIGPLKCWILTCSEAKFEKLLSSWKNLGNELKNVYDASTYLQQRLNCDEEYINLLSYRYPPLLKIPVQQIKLVLDFLFSVGYNTNIVCLSLRILKEDVELLKSRYSQFQSFNYRPSHVYYLMAKSQKYEKFINNLVEKGPEDDATFQIDSSK